MKRVFLGLASNYRGRVWQHVFARGAEQDSSNLKQALEKRYGKKAYLYHSGRSAIAVGIEAILPKGGPVVTQGLTCNAVIRAIKAAKCTPFYSDIDPQTLQYDYDKLEQTLQRISQSHVNFTKGIVIVQNTLGYTANIVKIEEIAVKYNFVILEDLAHSAGREYLDGREIGTVAPVVALSFGKGKAIDTINGGALLIGSEYKIKEPARMPSILERYQDRVYPLIGSFTRATWGIKLGKVWLGLAVAMRRVKKSADTKLEINTRLSDWQAKLALEQLNNLPKTPLREFTYIEKRAEFLEKARKIGYELDEIWYDTPVSPIRYEAEAEFTPELCPMTVWAAEHIINLPTWYDEQNLAPVRQLIHETQQLEQQKLEQQIATSAELNNSREGE